MVNLSHLILLPIAAGLLLWVVPESFRVLKGVASLILTLLLAYWGYQIFTHAPVEVLLFTPQLPPIFAFLEPLMQQTHQFLEFKVDALSQLMVLMTGIFGVLVSFYTLTKNSTRHFHTFLLITLGCSFGAILASHLLLFIFFWGVLGLTLYLLIPNRDEDSSAASKKTLIMIGSSDGIMILGIAILFLLTGTFNMSQMSVGTQSTLGIVAFLALVTGSFTKAGAFPFHSWIPDYTRYAPAASSALLPASLDKLLGIYFLVRICADIFLLSPWLRLLILSLGAITILAAVMMALIQHDFKKLLGFHAVSQVGYMVIGIGLGSAIGIAAGLFHMVNHALYKSGLFLAAGNLSSQTGEENLDKLGGLSKRMAVTFICSVIFALAISGVPPLNGFASKWLIYQGIIEAGAGDALFNKLWILWLAVAVLGSALTLASFIKFIAGSFLGNLQDHHKKLREVNILQWLPIALLALLCVALGVFSTSWVIPHLFYPIAGTFTYHGIWQASDVSMLILLSLALGILIYLFTSVNKFRVAESFTGGEKFEEDKGFPVTNFYSTIRQAPVLSGLYSMAYKGWFDVYHLSKTLILWVFKGFSLRHEGILQTYLLWILAGLILLLLIL